MPKIAFFDTKKYDQEIFSKLNKDYGFDIDFFESRLNEETVDLTKGYEITCNFANDTLNKEVIDKMSKNGVKFTALRSAGYNHVDLHAAKDKIKVARVPSYSPNAVAEHTVGLMLSINRKIHKAFYRTRDNNFSINGLLGFDMKDKTVGVIGTGKIGKTLIKILKGFDMNIVAYDKYPNEDSAKKLGFKYVELNELFKSSDIISLNCPLVNETYHMINEQTISLMKENVMIVNTGRGKLINSKDLIEALKEGKVGSAALDVYEEENEYFFEDHSSEIVYDDKLERLLSFPNVLVTSHQAFFTKEAITNIAKTTLENIKQYINKEKLENEVKYKK